MQQFYEWYFNPYLNFHRPCAMPEFRVDHKGRRRHVYRWDATPWEILSQLASPARHFKEGIAEKTPAQQATAMTDLEAARRIQQAKQTLFTRFHHQHDSFPPQ